MKTTKITWLIIAILLIEDSMDFCAQEPAQQKAVKPPIAIDDFDTPTRRYTDVVVKRIDADGLLIGHSGGVLKLKIAELPEPLQKRFFGLEGHEVAPMSFTKVEIDGRTYQNVNITKIKTDGIIFRHESGVTTVSYEKLPENFQKLYFPSPPPPVTPTKKIEPPVPDRKVSKDSQADSTIAFFLDPFLKGYEEKLKHYSIKDPEFFFESSRVVAPICVKIGAIDIVSKTNRNPADGKHWKQAEMKIPIEMYLRGENGGYVNFLQSDIVQVYPKRDPLEKTRRRSKEFKKSLTTITTSGGSAAGGRFGIQGVTTVTVRTVKFVAPDGKEIKLPEFKGEYLPDDQALAAVAVNTELEEMLKEIVKSVYSPGVAGGRHLVQKRPKPIDQRTKTVRWMFDRMGFENGVVKGVINVKNPFDISIDVRASALFELALPEKYNKNGKEKLVFGIASERIELQPFEEKNISIEMPLEKFQGANVSGVRADWVTDTLNGDTRTVLEAIAKEPRTGVEIEIKEFNAKKARE